MTKLVDLFLSFKYNIWNKFSWTQYQLLQSNWRSPWSTQISFANNDGAKILSLQYNILNELISIQTQHFYVVSTNSNDFLEQNIHITLYQRSLCWTKIWFWGKLNIRISYQFFMNSAVWEPCMRREFIGNSFSSKETLGYTEG